MTGFTLGYKPVHEHKLAFQLHLFTQSDVPECPFSLEYDVYLVIQVIILFRKGLIDFQIVHYLMTDGYSHPYTKCRLNRDCPFNLKGRSYVFFCQQI